MTVKKIQQDIISSMRKWQKIEDSSILSTTAIMAKTENLFIRLAMEIIQRDSQMHYFIQDWIARSLSTMPVVLTHDDLSEVWDMIEEHVALEKKMVALVKDSLACTKGNKMAMQEYLLEYLQDDEIKHNNMLKRLAMIRKDMLK